MTHTSVDLTDEQRANLAKLAAYLRTLPADYPDFEMSDYTNEDDKGSSVDRAYKAPCGTAACAAGHGPIAGIKPKRGENWHTYSKRAFVPQSYGDHSWEWCFSAYWSEIDNTVHGAAARIEYMLAHGTPTNAIDQMYGDTPLCYTPEYQSALAALNAETNEMVALSNGRHG